MCSAVASAVQEQGAANQEIFHPAWPMRETAAGNQSALPIS